MLKRRVAILFFILFPVTVYSQNIDIRLLRAFNSPQTLASDGFFRFASNSDSYMLMLIPAGMGAAGLIKKDDNLLRNAFVCGAATILSSGITLALKYSVNRDRPFVTYPDIVKKSGAGSPSFPSGHTSGAFAAATSVSLAYPKWYIIVPSYAWAGTVGYSRMHLGVHYPSDVLAGALIGSGSAWITYKVNKILLKSGHSSRNSPFS